MQYFIVLRRGETRRVPAQPRVKKLIFGLSVNKKKKKKDIKYFIDYNYEL